MHNKLRNNLISLGAAFAIVVGGSFFSEPLPPAGAVAASTAPAVDISPEARIAIALLGATISIAQASAEIEAADANADAANSEAADKAERPAPPSRPSITTRHKRPALGMPYFSFASFLPRAPQES